MGSTRSNGFINRIPVVNMFDRGVTDQFVPQWYDKASSLSTSLMKANCGHLDPNGVSTGCS